MDVLPGYSPVKLLNHDVKANAAGRRPRPVVGGSADWTDLRLQVRLHSEDDDGIGALVRFRDEADYYRFSMDAQRSFRRLVKQVGGQVTTLWEDLTRGFEVGREYLLVLECEGTVLRGFLDGVRLFEVRDGDLDSGRVRLYAWSNPGARFQAVRVAEPSWVPFHTFGREPRLPAGTRLRVHAGAAADAPEPEPLVHTRFAAPPGQHGDRLLPADAAHLRLLGPDGSALHSRTFLHPSAFSPLPLARVLRNRDGTGLFLLAPSPGPAGTRLTANRLRLALTYQRRSALASAVVLRQAGHDTPEQVTLEIPDPGRDAG